MLTDQIRERLSLDIKQAWTVNKIHWGSVQEDPKPPIVLVNMAPISIDNEAGGVYFDEWTFVYYITLISKIPANVNLDQLKSNKLNQFRSKFMAGESYLTEVFYRSLVEADFETENDDTESAYALTIQVILKAHIPTLYESP